MQQEVIAGESSADATSKKLTQFGLQVSEVMAFSTQLDHLSDDEQLATMCAANRRQQLWPGNSCTMVNCEITPVKRGLLRHSTMKGQLVILLVYTTDRWKK